MAEKVNERTDRCELREKIIRAASDEFAHNGIKKVRMDDIAALLGISKRTLYEIFKDKETLLIAVIEDSTDKHRALSEKIYKESSNVLEVVLKFVADSIKHLLETNRKVFSELKKYPKAYQMLKNNRISDVDRKIKFYAEGIEQGLFRNDVNYNILTLLLDEQFNLLLNSDVCNDFSFVEVFESITFTFIRGIVTEKGSKLLEQLIVEYRMNHALSIDMKQ